MNKINCFYCNKLLSKNYYKRHLNTNIHKKNMEKETDILTDIVGQDIMDIIGGYVEDIELTEKLDKVWKDIQEDMYGYVYGFYSISKYGDYEEFIELKKNTFMGGIEHREHFKGVWEDWERSYNELEDWVYRNYEEDNIEGNDLYEYIKLMGIYP